MEDVNQEQEMGRIRNRSLSRAGLLGMTSLVVGALACSAEKTPVAQSDSTPRQAASTPDLLGVWTKRESTLPPIELYFYEESGATRARLRLSGISVVGTVQTAPGTAVVSFPDRAPLNLRLAGSDTLYVRFDAASAEERVVRVRTQP